MENTCHDPVTSIVEDALYVIALGVIWSGVVEGICILSAIAWANLNS